MHLKELMPCQHLITSNLKKIAKMTVITHRMDFYVCFWIHWCMHAGPLNTHLSNGTQSMCKIQTEIMFAALTNLLWKGRNMVHILGRDHLHPSNKLAGNAIKQIKPLLLLWGWNVNKNTREMSASLKRWNWNIVQAKLSGCGTKVMWINK